MPNLKINNKGRAELINNGRGLGDTNMIAEIERIAYELKSGRDVSWGEMAFLQDEKTQKVIKKHFPDDVELWEMAGINENNWRKAHESAKKSKVRTMAESVLAEMITVKMDENAALDMLMTRLARWTTDPKETKLYEDMYQNYIDSGVFDGGEFDPMVIVDNDWVNYCGIVEESDDNFDKLLAVYKEQGLGDVSTEDIRGISYIEAVDDEEEPTAFLIRY